MFTSQNEQNFFMSHLNSSHKVLEYGSGESTLQIAKIVNHIVSIEHQANWYNKINFNLPKNCTLILKEPNIPYKEGTLCGSYEEFKDYIECPFDFSPFDIILIDGRARVECSKVCKKISHTDTIVFVHDFHRTEYQEINNYLELVEIVESMAKFKIKI